MVVIVMKRTGLNLGLGAYFLKEKSGYIAVLCSKGEVKYLSIVFKNWE